MIQLGCEQSYILTKLAEEGIPCVGLAPSDVLRDMPYSIYDLCYSDNFLETLTEDNLAILKVKIEECQRGYHIIGGELSNEWWQVRLPREREIERW